MAQHSSPHLRGSAVRGPRRRAQWVVLPGAASSPRPQRSAGHRRPQPGRHQVLPALAGVSRRLTTRRAAKESSPRERGSAAETAEELRRAEVLPAQAGAADVVVLHRLSSRVLPRTRGSAGGRECVSPSAVRLFCPYLPGGVSAPNCLCGRVRRDHESWGWISAHTSSRGGWGRSGGSRSVSLLRRPAGQTGDRRGLRPDASSGSTTRRPADPGPAPPGVPVEHGGRQLDDDRCSAYPVRSFHRVDAVLRTRCRVLHDGSRSPRGGRGGGG